MIGSQDKTFEKNRTEVSFREIFEFAPIGILIFQNDWKIKFVNNNFFIFKGVLGESPSDIIGKSIFDNRLFENVDIREDLMLIKKGETFEKEVTASRTLHGGNISILIKGAPISLDKENAGGIIILEDIKVPPVKHSQTLISSPDFQSFLNLIYDFFIVTDIEGNVKVSSSAGPDTFDFLFETETIKAPLQTKKVSSILFKKLIENVVSSNKMATTEIPFIKNGRELSAWVTLVPYGPASFEPELIFILVKDLSLRDDVIDVSKEAIRELTKYQQITSTVMDGLIGLNKNGKITFWNESASKLFGLTRSEVYGKFIGKIFSSIDENYFIYLLTTVTENKTWVGNLKIGDDETLAEYFHVKIGMIGDKEDESLILLCSNVTEQIKRETELAKSVEHVKNIVTNAHDFICTLDLKGRITYANPRFLEVFRYSEDEAGKLDFSDLLDPYYLMNQKFDLKEVAAGQTDAIELPMQTKNGQRIHTLASFSSVKNSSGTIQYYNIIFTDITLKKESEKDLLLIRSVFEASLNGIALISKNRFVLVNDSFVQIFGYGSASELLGGNPLDCVDENDRLRLSGFIEQAELGNDSPTHYYFTGRKKNHTTFEVENSISSYQIENEKFAVWVLRDVTEEKKAQNALQLSEERYRNITENINECIWAAENVKGELKAVLYTPAIKKITNYEAKAFLDDPELWGKIIHPDDVDNVGNKLDELYGDKSRNSEMLEYRIIDALGNIIWIENKITVARDEKGKIQKVFGIISDISLAKTAAEELKKSAQSLTELNEAKDRFISIISHDLRTPFSSIIGFTDLLLNDDEMDDEKRTQYTEFIQESAKNMLGLVNSLLDWTRLQTGRIKFEPERINVKDIILKSVQILSGSALQKKINLVSELDSDVYIHADDGLILQVFNNLISNAIKFTKPEGNIKIGARANVQKKQIEFSVKDDGVGIRKEDVEKLFKVDQKFSTSGTAGERGSGLGLSLVYDIIHKHGGDIWVESELGKGTEFIFSIPVASANILLVDDMKADRLLYSKLLKNLIPNYNILEASNGKQALDIIKQTSPALVITDHKMPVMSGYDLVKQLNITELKYKPPVIVLSSDITKSVEADYKDLAVEYVFQKPVSLSTFKTAIEKSLRKAIFS